MQKMTTASRERGGMKQKNGEINFSRLYHRKYDLQLIRKIAAQNSDPIISGLARRVVKSLEREHRNFPNG